VAQTLVSAASRLVSTLFVRTQERREGSRRIRNECCPCALARNKTPEHTGQAKAPAPPNLHRAQIGHALSPARYFRGSLRHGG